MKREFHFTTHPTLCADPLWADPDRLPDQTSVPASRLPKHPVELRLLLLVGAPSGILLALGGVAWLIGLFCL